MKIPKETYSLPPWHKQPLHLTQEQMNDPQQVLHDFFAVYPVEDIRHLLKEWLDETMLDRDDVPVYIILLYDDLLPMLEAACLLYRKAG
ncbi:hypothetical protein ACTHGU_04150 [Chitinophagaceae bacterium MMS25-I14]